MGLQKKELNKKSTKLAHVANRKAKEELRKKKDGKVKLTMTEDNGKVQYEKATNGKVSEFKRKKIEKNLNEKKIKIKEAEEETVEQFDNQGFFVLPTNVINSRLELTFTHINIYGVH